MSDYYILKDKKVVECDDIHVWGKWYEINNNRRVDLSTENGVRVSTVFLGIDHSFSSSGPLLLFETMIFGGKHDEEQWRYSTWDEAVIGHKKACEIVGVPSGAVAYFRKIMRIVRY